MKIQKTAPLFIDLSFLEKFVLNTFFIIIMGYIFLTGFYRNFLLMNDLRQLATVVPLILIVLFFVSRIVSLHNKSALFKESDGRLQTPVWNFYKGGKRISFDCGEISSVKKSFWGLYSSFVFTIGNIKIRIPAELRNVGELISELSGHLPKEQVAALAEFHKNAQCVSFEMEKSSKFLRIFCFLIPPISFFIVRVVWGVFSEVITFFWIFISLILPFFGTIIHWILLKTTVSNFAVFSRVSALFPIFGALLYMTVGIVYRQFYLWLVFNFRTL
ncbi:MAG: hypothetical protein FWE23_04405 [Chitinivibrionia bacterium]|nr:hypothetical protein [Chitinivibrionia bacterium]